MKRVILSAPPPRLPRRIVTDGWWLSVPPVSLDGESGDGETRRQRSGVILPFRRRGRPRAAAGQR